MQVLRLCREAGLASNPSTRKLLLRAIASSREGPPTANHKFVLCLKLPDRQQLCHSETRKRHNLDSAATRGR